MVISSAGIRDDRLGDFRNVVVVRMAQERRREIVGRLLVVGDDEPGEDLLDGLHTGAGILPRVEQRGHGFHQPPAVVGADAEPAGDRARSRA